MPDETVPDELTVEHALELIARKAEGPRTLGDDPETSKPIFVLSGPYGPYVQLDGTAVIDQPDAVEPLVDYFLSISGEHPDWDEYRRAMRQQRRVLLRVSIDKVGPTRAG